MAARRRKTLVVCRSCHLKVHGGSWKPRKQKITTGEPDAVKAARPVRREADGKVLRATGVTRLRPTLQREKEPAGAGR